MPRRENSGSRRSPRLEARSRLLVVCGTAKTEEQYFRGLRSSVANRAVDVVLVNRPRSPLEVVRYAIGYVRDAAKDFDETWCVFDVDQFDISSAIDVATDFDVALGVSNPCFELWLLLHYENCRRFQNACNDTEGKLKRFVPAYDKAFLRFSDFAGGVVDAIARAKALDPSGQRNTINPSTSVWRLAEKIMEQR
jgi:hypothetical protein